jgi:hypothetical protein
MMPHLQYLKLQLQFKSKITEHLYTKRELVEASKQAKVCVKSHNHITISASSFSASYRLILRRLMTHKPTNIAIHRSCSAIEAHRSKIVLFLAWSSSSSLSCMCNISSIAAFKSTHSRMQQQHYFKHQACWLASSLHPEVNQAGLHLAYLHPACIQKTTMLVHWLIIASQTT